MPNFEQLRLKDNSEKQKPSSSSDELGGNLHLLGWSLHAFLKQHKVIEAGGHLPICGCQFPTYSVAHRLPVRDRGATSVNASGSRYRHKQVLKLQQQSWKCIGSNVIPVYSRCYSTWAKYTGKPTLCQRTEFIRVDLSLRKL